MTMTRHLPRIPCFVATVIGTLVLAACGQAQAPVSAAPSGQTVGAVAAAPRVTAAAPAPAPHATRHMDPADMVAPDPVNFEDAVKRAGAQLFESARAEIGDEPRPVVIDPLIDANTGAQTVSTAKMGQQLEGILKQQKKAGWSIKPLTRETLAAGPLLLIGTLTPVTVERSVDKQPDAFRIWLTLIDLRTNRVVAKQLDRATVGSVNAEPLPFYRDSPTWHKDKTVLGYINSCQKDTRIGDPAQDDYLARLPAAAVINEAMMAYNQGKVPAANKLYREAQGIADAGDLRVLNGLYLTSWQLGQRDEAKDAFGKLVASGLEAKRLPMKLLFKAGGTSFNETGDLATQYQLWLATMASEAGKVPACVRVVGHTSRTGSASVNEKLSKRRAEAVARLLEDRNRSLSTRLSVAGVGSREALVGLGTDDQRDALDRRVEFRVVDCI